MEGFSKAIDMVNKLNPDFVITGGDLIYDALGKSYPRADSLYTIYDSLQQLFNMSVYNTMGNHEVFGLYEKSGVEVTHPEFGKKMFEDRIGKRYYSFDRDNWHIMVLDDIGFTDDRKYFAQVDSLQMEWIEHDLAKLAPNTNIIVSAHIPFETVFINHYFKNQGLSDSGIVVTNGPEVLQLYEGKNLKLVLQGHTHVLEDVFIDGIHFVTGGAVSAHWWRGPNFKTEEGFLLVKVYEDTFTYEYIDMNWEVKSAE
jgi:predicted MPP superfamily phosphohydrolase